MKKTIIKILCLIMVAASVQVTSFAKSGDVIGYTKYSDIGAYINHYPITSYNINGYTSVVAEDLRNYGFYVEWNGEERSLKITINPTATQITPYGTVYKYSAKAGQNAFPYLESDITTYVNGQKVDSFNINGRTCIYMEALAPYGDVVWVPEVRALKMWVDGLPINSYIPLSEAPVQQVSSNTIQKTTSIAAQQNIADIFEISIDPTANGAASYVQLYVTNKSNKDIILSSLNFCSNLWQFKKGLTITVSPGVKQPVSIYTDVTTRQYYTTTYGTKKNTINVSAESLASVGVKYADGTDSHRVYFNCNGIQRWD